MLDDFTGRYWSCVALVLLLLAVFEVYRLVACSKSFQDIFYMTSLGLLSEGIATPTWPID